MKDPRRLLVLGLLAGFPAFPWGNEGHQIVARIAARNLTPAARVKIIEIVRNAPDDDLSLKAIAGNAGDPQPPDSAVEEILATIATWPDHMPGGKGVTEPWHYIDIGLFEGPSHMAERCPDGCVDQKIAEIVQDLPQNTPLGDFGPDRELRFLVHFLGDIHQPLHCSTDADAGANCIRTSGFPSFPEMHAVWDTALVRELIAESSPDPAADIITALQARQSEFASLTDPDGMAAESFGIAKDTVYPSAHPKIPVIDEFVDLRPSECAQKAPKGIRRIKVKGPASFSNDATMEVIREQLFKGGVRLAAILNTILAPG